MRVEATIAQLSPGSLSTHDLVLSFMPGPILLGLAAGMLLGIPLTVAMTAGSVPSAAAMAYALFYAPPSNGRAVGPGRE